MNLIGIVTGDIVGSTSISFADRDRLLSVVEALMAGDAPDDECDSSIYHDGLCAGNRVPFAAKSIFRFGDLRGGQETKMT